jgi:hypothetical protein
VTQPTPIPLRTRDLSQERVTLVDLLDRVLAGGITVSGEVVLSVADVDLVVISLRALVASVGTLIGAEDDFQAGALAGLGHRREP